MSTSLSPLTCCQIYVRCAVLRDTGVLLFVYYLAIAIAEVTVFSRKPKALLDESLDSVNRHPWQVRRGAARHGLLSPLSRAPQ